MVKNTLLQGLRFYRDHFVPVMVFVLLGFGILILDPILLVYTDQFNSKFWIPWMFIPAGFLSVRSAIGLYFYMDSVRSGSPLKIREALLKVKGFYWSTFFYSIISALAFYLGNLFLIVPGILAGTYFYLVPISSLFVPNRSPFRESIARVRPHFWPVCGILILFLVVLGVGRYLTGQIPVPDYLQMAIGIIGYWFLWGISTVVNGVVFFELGDTDNAKAPVSKEKEASGFDRPIRGIWAFIASWVTMGIVFLVAAAVLAIFARGIQRPFGWKMYYKLFKGNEPALILKQGIEMSPPDFWIVRYKNRDGMYLLNYMNNNIQKVRVGAIPFTEIPPDIKKNLGDDSFFQKLVEFIVKDQAERQFLEVRPATTIQIHGKEIKKVDVVTLEKQRWIYYFKELNPELILMVSLGIFENKASGENFIKEEADIFQLIESAEYTGRGSIYMGGNEMEPTLHRGDQILIEKIEEGEPIQRGEIVAYESPYSDGSQMVLRVVGLPNEEIDIHWGGIYANGKRVEIPDPQFYWKLPIRLTFPDRIPPKHYFVLADNFMVDLRQDLIGRTYEKLIKYRVTEILYPTKHRRSLRVEPTN